jgi:hypothetical protein
MSVLMHQNLFSLRVEGGGVMGVKIGVWKSKASMWDFIRSASWGAEGVICFLVAATEDSNESGTQSVT